MFLAINIVIVISSFLHLNDTKNNFVRRLSVNNKIGDADVARFSSKSRCKSEAGGQTHTPTHNYTHTFTYTHIATVEGVWSAEGRSL